MICTKFRNDVYICICINIYMYIYDYEITIRTPRCNAMNMKGGKLNIRFSDIVLGPSPSSVFTFYANGVSVAPLVLVV